jgi:hypothetical protein
MCALIHFTENLRTIGRTRAQMARHKVPLADWLMKVTSAGIRVIAIARSDLEKVERHER